MHGIFCLKRFRKNAIKRTWRIKSGRQESWQQAKHAKLYSDLAQKREPLTAEISSAKTLDFVSAVSLRLEPS